MFGRRNVLTESQRHRAGKATKSTKRSFRDHGVTKTTRSRAPSQNFETSPPLPSNLTSAIITIVCGREQRLFAAHEDVLCHSPFFAAACRGQFQEAHTRRIDLPDEEPEIFSSVLEYLYKGDYYPRIHHNKRRDAWELEDGGAGGSTVFHSGVAGVVLKDTVIYCTADKYGLEELKRLALRKQGLQSGIQCSTILTSARYAYANTPDSDPKLRAHYLSLIVRSRTTFKRSGTMQMEMEVGGKLFFDLFVAMCNHLDDVSNAV
ncbi:MAG: COP9 signalosome (CSN) subunit [Watsoniomyces obsoletus]|nr:MAG: COP9 signalosome (CSN) subunit [Watsoniomyces obsoletus]